MAAGEAQCCSLLTPFADDPDRSVVIVDFDGSLAPIVADPAAAAPLPDAAGVLARLVRRAGRVAVVSGRPVDFLRDALPVEGLVVFGQYGVERFDGGAVSLVPEARAWTAAVRAAADEAEAALPGLLVERKGDVGVALHWRQRADLEADAAALGRTLAARHRLRLEPGRRALELRPPVAVDKGTATRELAAGAHAALVIGDDRGDVEAFVALRRLVEERRLGHAVRVAVRSAETPDELVRHCDVEVDGPQGALRFLERLAAALRGQSSRS